MSNHIVDRSYDFEYWASVRELAQVAEKQAEQEQQQEDTMRFSKLKMWAVWHQGANRAGLRPCDLLGVFTTEHKAEQKRFGEFNRVEPVDIHRHLGTYYLHMGGSEVWVVAPDRDLKSVSRHIYRLEASDEAVLQRALASLTPEQVEILKRNGLRTQ